MKKLLQIIIQPFIIGILFSGLNPAFSLDRVWTNVIGDNLWSEPSNWIPIGTPQSGDSVNTTYGDVLIIPANYSASIKYLKLLGNLTIEENATLTFNDGQFNCNGPTVNKGTIYINDSPTIGLIHSSFQSNSRPFTNEGSIFIENSAEEGLWIRFDQTFTNATGALIEISNSADANIELQGVFSNRGTLIAKQSTSNIALLMEHEESSLINLECAKVSLKDEIIASDGLISNFAFFQQNFDGVNDIEDDLFINYVALEDRFGSFEDADVSNLGVWVSPFEDPVMEGEPTAIFKNAFPLDVEISNVYLERDLLTAAGTYDDETNLWVPSGAAAGNTSFYIEIHDVDGSCSDTLRFDLLTGVEEVNYWLGGSGSWQFGFNWSKASVPSPSDKVGIFNDEDEVNIPTSYFATAKNIVLKGKLTIGLLATLKVDPPQNEIAVDIKEGELLNRGKLELLGAATGVDSEKSLITNHNNISCEGTGTCIALRSIINDGSLFINNGVVDSDSSVMISSTKSLTKNYGSINSTVTSYAVAISGDTIYNEGDINLKGFSNQSGIGIDGLLINAQAGELNISKFDIGFFGKGENEGNIFIDSCEIGLSTNVGGFANMGEMNIRQCQEGIKCNSAQFINEDGSELYLRKNQTGINITLIGDFYNTGLVDIDSTFTNGIHCIGDFFIQLDGRVKINNSLNHGFFMSTINADLFMFDNARLSIENSSWDHINLENNCNALLTGNAVIWLQSDTN